MRKSQTVSKGISLFLAMNVLIGMGWTYSVPAKAQELGEQRIQKAAFYKKYEARRDSMIRFFAVHRQGKQSVAAKLYQGHDVDGALARLDSLMEHPSGDMFWMFPFIQATFAGWDRIPESYRKRMRKTWDTYTPYRGDTENHWLMYYTSLYLITQKYPDDPADSWFNGKSSVENHQEARAYIRQWMSLTTAKGQGEFDSPRYINFYVAPLAQLYAFAEEPAMRKRARMMLDYVLADFAVDTLNGLYTGAFSRTYPDPTLHRWKNRSRSLAWLLFGNTSFQAFSSALILAMSGYEPPPILYHIATDRSQPYVHKERKRTRRRIRYSDQRRPPVYKTTYMSKDYAVGSIQGGLLQPIQQHTWEVLWASKHPEKGSNILFALHPYHGGRELGMYFPEEPELFTKAVVASKPTYVSPKKWTGASPYEQVFQHRDALVALYDIPEGTRFPHIDGFFPKTLARREEDPSGWIFARGGDALIAYYPLAPYEWREEDEVWRLFSPHLKNGAVVQVASAEDYASFDAFKEAVKALPLRAKRAPTPQVRFETLGGDRLTFAYDETPTVNGKRVDYKNWPLFDGPFMYAEPGSHALTLRYGPMRRQLNFSDTPTVTTRVVAGEEAHSSSATESAPHKQ